MTTQFKKAERKQVKLKLAICGPSGSGKTYSALCLAQGIGQKIALIDTENGSASLYSDRFHFDTLELSPPYTVAKYQAAISMAEKEGYEILIIDSITHAWAGDGGLLSKKESLDSSGRGNSYTNWASISKDQEAFKSSLLNCDLHLICTMRSKQDYALEMNEKGKQVPVKLGMAPIQRDGMEYEFSTVFDIAMNHEASVSKDRTGLFDGQCFKITEKTGHEFMHWLSLAKPIEKNREVTDFNTGPKLVNPQPWTATKDLIAELYAMTKAIGLQTKEQATAKIIEISGAPILANMTHEQYEKTMSVLRHTLDESKEIADVGVHSTTASGESVSIASPTDATPNTAHQMPLHSESIHSDIPF